MLVSQDETTERAELKAPPVEEKAIFIAAAYRMSEYKWQQDMQDISSKATTANITISLDSRLTLRNAVRYH